MGTHITPNCTLYLKRYRFRSYTVSQLRTLIYTVTREVNKTVTIKNTSTMYGPLATVKEE
jgi:hypothetical protein